MFIFLIFLFVTQCHAYGQVPAGRYQVPGTKPDLPLNVKTTSSPKHLPSTKVPITPAESDLDEKLPMISEALRNEIKSECLNGKCKGQKKEVVEKRRELRQQMISFGKRAAEVDRQLSKTQELKKALLEDMGLGDVIDPEDDGLYQGDVLLSAEQADEMIRSIKDKNYLKKSKASGLIFETQLHKKWDISKPIKYTIDPRTFERRSEEDMLNLTKSIIDIQLSVPCIRFERITYPFVNGVVGNFSEPLIVLFAGQGCYSDVGRSSLNYISLASGCWSTSIITHEILHTLGVWHMQSRPDRDRYITINKAMVESSMMHNFNIVDAAKNSVYGTKYDLISMMHYINNAFSRDRRIPTIFSKDASMQDLMGTAERLRESDKTLLKKMYCVPSSCKDRYPNCAEYAPHKPRDWMIRNCKSTMNCYYK